MPVSDDHLTPEECRELSSLWLCHGMKPPEIHESHPLYTGGMKLLQAQPHPEDDDPGRELSFEGEGALRELLAFVVENLVASEEVHGGADGESYGKGEIVALNLVAVRIRSALQQADKPVGALSLEELDEAIEAFDAVEEDER